MNRLIKIGMAVSVILAAAVSCEKPYEKHYPLAVSSYEYRISADGKTFPLYVWCDGSWRASLDTDADWIAMEEGTDHGKGNGLVRITVLPNYGAARDCQVVLRSGSRQKEVKINQVAYLFVPVLEFTPESETVPASGGPVSVTFTSNIPADQLTGLAISAPAWIEGMTSLQLVSDNYVDGNNRKVTLSFSFYVKPNDTGVIRNCSLSVPVPPAYQSESVKSFRLTQNAE